MEPLQQNTGETPIQKPTQPSIPATENTDPKAPQMRTFSTDLAEELRKHQGSAMKIAVMENERRFKEQEQASNDPKKNSRFVAGGVVFLFIAICTIVGIYLYQQKVNAPLPIEKNPVPISIVQSEGLSILNITGESASDIKNSITDTVKKSTIQTGMMDNIYITQGTSTSETRLPSKMFLSAIGAHVTPDFSNALVSDFMVGIYSYDQQNLFLVLRGTQHDFMLSGMLQWEPYLIQDLAPLFGIDTSGNSAYLLDAPFVETLIENHDTRAILDVNKKPVLFYSFLDENTVIITNNSKTLTEAVRRINN